MTPSYPETRYTKSAEVQREASPLPAYRHPAMMPTP